MARTALGRLIAPHPQRPRLKQNPKWRAALKVEWENFAPLELLGPLTPQARLSLRLRVYLGKLLESGALIPRIEKLFSGWARPKCGEQSAPSGPSEMHSARNVAPTQTSMCISRRIGPVQSKALWTARPMTTRTRFSSTSRQTRTSCGLVISPGTNDGRGFG